MRATRCLSSAGKCLVITERAVLPGKEKVVMDALLKLQAAARAAPGLDHKGALELIDRTRAGQIVKGYRGRPALDRDALAEALAGLSRLVIDGGELIESIDINPFLLSQTGGVALDGLVVLRRN